MLWEIPAGRRDGDESPDETARRELGEETGYRCGALRRLTRIWTTPGFTNETIDLYLATDLTLGETRLEADEILEVHPTRWSAVRAMIREGEITDGKTLSALLYVACEVRGGR
jgi:ADP-ribose pyrophosphatase